MRALLVFTNAPDRAIAEKIARHLVEERLAACVSILADCTSIYRWQGTVESACEVPLLIKTRESRFEAVQEAIRKLHPYELPEVVAVTVDAGLPQYLQWLAAESTPAG